MDQISIPFAKFESDIALLRGTDQQHPLLPQLDGIFEEGTRLKKGALAAMQDGVSPPPVADVVKTFLNNVRTNSKAAAAFASGNKGGA